MFRYFKGQPTDYVIRYAGGRVVSEGPGRAFFYLPFNTQVVAIPTQSLEAPFAFRELTREYQEVTLQGQATYRVRDPKAAASQLNFGINPQTGARASDDPDKLGRRVVNLVQVETRAEIARRPLEEAVREATTIASAVAERVRAQPALAALGVELQTVDILSARPTPEVGKALEAEYREALLRKADEAVYDRRAAAVRQEQTIKEKELASEAALEEQRKGLIDLHGTNAMTEADYKGQAREREAAAEANAAAAQLAVFRELEPRVLLAYALRELGANAQHIGNLTITTEMLASLLQATAGRAG